MPEMPYTTFGDIAWYCGNTNGTPFPIESETKVIPQDVAGKLPNGFGLYDIHGNALEMVHDVNGCSYPNTEATPCVPSNCTTTDCYRTYRRMYRGGYDSTSHMCNMGISIRLISTTMGTSKEVTRREERLGFRIRRRAQ